MRMMRLMNLGVHQRHGHVSHAERLAVARAGKNYVFHPCPAQGFRRLFAQDPADGVADI
jgi:hypothetical protein